MKRRTRPPQSNFARSAVFYLALLFVMMGLGCSGWRYPRAPTLDSIAEVYVRVALELGERDPDSLDFAAVPPALRETAHRLYPTYNVIDREVAQALTQLQASPWSKEQQSRAQSLTRQLQAAHARIAMLQGHTLPFTAEASILFDTAPLPDTHQRERDAVRARIAAMLPEPGRSPAEAYDSYTKRFLIPPDRLPAVMNAALAACRRQTRNHLALPANESVDLRFVVNKPWSAFSRYRGDAHSTIEINAGFPLTIDQALELACHEGYPGHHVFNTLRDVALVQKRHLPEAEVQLTFSPQSYVSESAAAYAPRLAFSEQERTRIEGDILFPLAGLPSSEAAHYVAVSTLVRALETAEPAIAQQYLDGNLEFVRAAQHLQAEMLMQHGESTLLYLNEYRSYMLAYTDGPRRIAALLQGSPDRDAAWRLYRELAEAPSPVLPVPER